MEQTHALSAPGLPAATIIETGINDAATLAKANAPATDGPPAFVSPTDGMTESQAAAMRWVDANRATLAKDPDNAWLQRQYRQAVQHALHGAPPPDWLPVGADGPQPAESSEATPATNDIHAQPHSPEQLAQFRVDAINRGLNPAVADVLATMASDCAVPAPVANDIKAVALAHYGPDGRMAGVDSIPVLDDEGLAEMYAAAVDKYGEETFTDLTAAARETLQRKGLLAKFDELGFTRSTLAFDRRVLRALAYWGKQ